MNLGTDVIRYRYYNQFLKNDLAYYNGRVKINLIKKVFHDYYSASLLNTLGCSIELNQKSNWIFNIFKKSNIHQVQYPIRHLLMMNFLGFTSESFFTSFIEFKPFVDEPHPCLNHAAEHYGELRIEKCEVFDNLQKTNNKGKPVGIFNCDCGFIYERIGPDKSDEDRFKYTSIREYGSIWISKFEEMWNDLALSLNEIARRLKISYFSLTLIAHYLNFPMNTSGTRVSKTIISSRSPRKTLSEIRKFHRTRLLNILKLNPKVSRYEISRLANFNYVWLLKNDSEWVQNHFPKVLKSTQKKRSNWEEIDKKLSILIKKTCEEIYSITPPKRVCKIEIVSRIGHKKWLRKWKLPLPKTIEILNEKLETLEDYKIRNLKFVENRFIEERIIPTKTQLLHQSGIYSRVIQNSDRVQKELNNSLNSIQKTLT